MALNVTYLSEFFHSKEKALAFLIEMNILEKEKECPRCRRYSLRLREFNTNNNRIFYRCSRNICRIRVSIFSIDFVGCRIPLNQLLYTLFCYLCNMRNYTFSLNSGISETTYIRFKGLMYPIVEKFCSDRFQPIGGPGIRVQLDETVICRRRRIRSATTADFTNNDTIWLFGGIEENNRKKFFLYIVENRTSEVLTRVLSENVIPGTILVTDRYPSYPTTANNLQMDHIIVNHSEGFINQQGFHTNYIENLWSDLKLYISSMHGVMHSNINYYIVMFNFKKKYLNHYDKNDINDAFEVFLSKIFI